MNRFNKVVFGQKAFILNPANEILILKRIDVEVYKGYWDVPGGKVEKGDTLFQALKREVKEETNLEVNTIILTLSSSLFKGMLANTAYVYRNIYLVKAAGNLKLSKEHSEYSWIKPEALIDFQFPEDEDLQMVIKKLPEKIKNLDLSQTYSFLN